jgi:hypothetical protein
MANYPILSHKSDENLLGKQTKKNEFGAIYGELYHLEGITSYKQLSSQRFETVMKWLSDWYASLTNGKDLPF